MGGIEKFRFIDLFAGIGGMRIGFESAGGRCVYSSEWNKFSQQTYEANFGDVPDGDITKVDAAGIPDHDILVAGFPCQPFSIAGVSCKKFLGRPHGFEDKTQGTLFFDICRILKVKQPSAFLLENVKNLKSHDGGNTFRIITDSLSNLGYVVNYRVMNAKGLVPQARERVFLVGMRSDTVQEEEYFEFPSISENGIALKSILEKRVDKKYTLPDGTWRAMRRHAEHHRKAGNGFGYNIADLNEPAKTMTARYYKDGGEILIGQKNKNPRKLTPRECARLMGFPEGFKIPVSDNQAYRQFGNSVVVPLVKVVAKKLSRHLTGPTAGRTPAYRRITRPVAGPTAGRSSVYRRITRPVAGPTAGRASVYRRITRPVAGPTAGRASAPRKRITRPVAGPTAGRASAPRKRITRPVAGPTAGRASAPRKRITRPLG